MTFRAIMMNISPRHVRLALGILFLLSLVSCTGLRLPDTSTRLALLAPFEGRYREIGYNALYAVRLALSDSDMPDLDLLAVDDGGTVDSAVDRAEAITRDPEIVAVIALGPHASHPAVQQELGTLPMLVVGYWGHEPSRAGVVMLHNVSISDQISVDSALDIVELAALEGPFSASDLVSLTQFPALREDLSGITVLSSGSLPTESFREQYLAQGQYIPEPGLLASLSFDATGWVIAAIEASQTIETVNYQGLNGAMSVGSGYWREAPLRFYRFDEDGRLTPFIE